jgi:formate hydrogenlyase subunit 3/multisubunit Na+/H+ antiporter MnhD subunit
MVSPVLLLAVPLGLALCVPLVGRVSRKATGFVPVIASLFNLVVSIRLLPTVLEEPIVANLGGFSPPFGITLFAGPVGVLLSALIALAGLVVSLYALSYIKTGPTVRYHTLYMLLLVGATGVVLTGDVFNLFVFFEILCISSYALVAYVGDRAGIEASIKYLIQGALGSALLLIGIGLLYGIFGTLNMADIAARMGSADPTSVFVAMALIVVGLGVEAAMFPLNAWLPDAHSSAPSSISAILSGIAIQVGLYAVIRMVFTVFGASSMFLFFAFMGLLTLLIGELCAFAQSNIKRMLAYSSIGQIGLILFAVGIATAGSVTGGLFQMVSHTLSKALLFLAVGYMVYRSAVRRIPEQVPDSALRARRAGGTAAGARRAGPARDGDRGSLFLQGHSDRLLQEGGGARGQAGRSGRGPVLHVHLRHSYHRDRRVPKPDHRRPRVRRLGAS